MKPPVKSRSSTDGIYWEPRLHSNSQIQSIQLCSGAQKVNGNQKGKRESKYKTGLKNLTWVSTSVVGFFRNQPIPAVWCTDNWIKKNHVLKMELGKKSVSRNSATQNWGRLLQRNSAPQAGAGETQSHKGLWLNINGGLELNSGSGIFLRWKEQIHWLTHI